MVAKQTRARPTSTPRGTAKKGASPLGLAACTLSVPRRDRVKRTARSARAVRWGNGVTPSPATSAPMPAPVTPPRLNMPWKADIMDRLDCASMAAASAFMAMSWAPLATPSTASARKSSQPLPASAGPGMARHKASVAHQVTRPAPTRATSQPAVGKVRMEPTGRPSRASPSPPSLRPRSAWTAGMRANQLPNSMLLSAKAMAVVRLAGVWARMRKMRSKGAFQGGERGWNLPFARPVWLARV